SLDLPWALGRMRPLDLMHSHVLGRLGGVARSVARARGLPYVVTIHGGYLDLPTQVSEALARPLEGGFEYGKLFGVLLGARRVLRDASAVLTCNPREAELLQAHLPGQRIVNMPHGIDAR